MNKQIETSMIGMEVEFNNLVVANLHYTGIEEGDTGVITQVHLDRDHNPVYTIVLDTGRLVEAYSALIKVTQ